MKKRWLVLIVAVALVVPAAAFAAGSDFEGPNAEEIGLSYDD